MTIRPLTIQDLRAWWGDVELTRTIKGFAVLDGDEVKGVSGLMYLHSSIVAFAEMGEDGQKYPLTIMRVTRAMKALMQGIVAPIFAVADEQYPNSAAFLEHCGFEQVVGRQYVFKKRG